MPYTKRMVCLANSRKHNGRCVAGKEVDSSGPASWIRPVSRRPSHEISGLEMRYQNGGTPKLLDVLDIQFSQHDPQDYQTENHIIDDSMRWRHVGGLTWADACALVDQVNGPLWMNGHSSSRGENDQVPEYAAANFSHSLVLIRPDSSSIEVANEPQYDGGMNRNVARADFRYSGHRYRLKLTDPEAEDRYRKAGKGSHPLRDALFCISLGEPFDGYAYKLVAAIITP